MFRIVDGRDFFYQWDLDRQVAVEDNSITEVHFCNRTDECSLVVEVKDGIANVPNLILQKSFDVRVFGYDGKATRFDKVFKVKPRTKPADYVYTETELKNYSDLAARIDEIERNGVSEEVVAGAVEDYLEKNPVDVEGYATEAYVDEAVKNVQVDLTGYATEEYVDEAISGITIEFPEGSEIDLTGYATEKWVNDQGYAKETDLDSYATRTELNTVSNSIPTKVSQLSNDKNYLTKHQDISHLATIGQVQNVESKIPTKTSQLTNDSGYLTEHQDLSGKADKVHTHPSYALKTEIPSVEGFATEKYVDDAIAGIELPDENQVTYELVLPEVGGIVTDEKTIECLNTAYNTAIPLCSYDNCLVMQRNVRSAVKQVVLTAVKQPVISDSKTFYEYDLTFTLNTVTSAWTFTSVDKQARKHFTNVSELENDANFATEAYVNEAIANIEIPEGGSGSGSTQKTYTFNLNSVTVSDSEKALVADIAQALKDGTNAYNNYLLYARDNFGTYAITSISYVSPSDEDYYGVQMPYKVSYVPGQVSTQLVEFRFNKTDGEFQNRLNYTKHAIDEAGGSVDLSGCAKYYSIASLANLSEADYTKLKEIVAAGELNSYEFSIGGKYKPLTVWSLGNGEIVFVYGVFEGATNNTIYAYRVNPTAATSSLFLNYKMTSSEDVTQIVNDALASSGGGSSGSSITPVVFIGWDNDTLMANTPNALEELAYLFNYYVEHCTTPPDRIYYFKNTNNLDNESDHLKLVTQVTCTNYTWSEECSINLLSSFDVESQLGSRASCALKRGADGKATPELLYYQSTDYSLTLNIPVWINTTSLSDSGLYDATEIFIQLECDGAAGRRCRISSHMLVDKYDESNLSSCAHKYFNFTTPDGIDNKVPYWYYDGSQINIEGIDNWTLTCLAYKYQ